MIFNRIMSLCIMSVCCAFLPVASDAAIFYVNSPADAVDASPGNGVCATAGGVCTLRAAIQEANTLVGADTIVLKAKKYYLTIAGAGEDAAATGDLDISGDLTIKGVNSAQTIINGGAVDRVFHITSPFVVKFVNLSIQNGFAATANGGGLYNAGGSVTLSLCSVANNVSTGNMGGGIFSSGLGGSLNIKSSLVTNNSLIATSNCYGGGVTAYNGGTLKVTASKISYNSVMALTASEALGGGIMALVSSGAIISGCKFQGNSATSAANAGGGGLCLA